MGGGGDRVSVVGIANRYELDSVGLEPQWGQEIFSSSHQSTPNLGPTQSPVKWHRVTYPMVKWRGRGFDHSHPSSDKAFAWLVMGRLYLYRDDPRVLSAEFCVIGHATRYSVLGTLCSRGCRKLFGTLTSTGCGLLTLN